jgi:hypothetical protein
MRMVRASLAPLVACVCLALLCPSAAGAKSGTERAGDVLQVAVPAAAFTTTLWLRDTRGQREFLESLALDLAITEGLKYSINKSRPENNGDHAFPSGHTAAAFQGASFIQVRYGWRYGLPLYMAAAFVGWSRVEGESDKHDAADVISGAAIGIASSYLLARHRGEKRPVLTPTGGDGTYGCYLTVTW